MDFYKPIPGAPNFTIQEFLASQTAKRRGIDNTPGKSTVEALCYLAQQCLQPARDHFGRPMVISSGYRSPALNSAVGGSTTSHHCFGHAADFTIPGMPLWDIFAWLYANTPFTELIAEELPDGWIHVALAKGREAEKSTKYKLSGQPVRRASFDEIKKILRGAK